LLRLPTAGNGKAARDVRPARVPTEAATEQSKGFTLLEALAACCLAAVLAGFGTTRLPVLLNGIRLAGAARTVATVLRLARGRALAGDTEVEVRFDGPPGGLETRVGGITLERRALPAGVAFTSLPALGRIRFQALGTAENGTVALAAGATVRRVIVNQRGRVRLQ